MPSPSKPVVVRVWAPPASQGERLLRPLEGTTADGSSEGHVPGGAGPSKLLPGPTENKETSVLTSTGVCVVTLSPFKRAPRGRLLLGLRLGPLCSTSGSKSASSWGRGVSRKAAWGRPHGAGWTHSRARRQGRRVREPPPGPAEVSVGPSRPDSASWPFADQAEWPAARSQLRPLDRSPASLGQLPGCTSTRVPPRPSPAVVLSAVLLGE